MKNIVTTAVVLSLALVAPSGAGPFEDGLAAYGRGDHAAATHLWRPLADQGNGLAQHNAGLIYQSGRGVPQDDAAASGIKKRPTNRPNRRVRKHSSLPTTMAVNWQSTTSDIGPRSHWARHFALMALPLSLHSCARLG